MTVVAAKNVLAVIMIGTSQEDVVICILHDHYADVLEWIRTGNMHTPTNNEPIIVKKALTKLQRETVDKIKEFERTHWFV